MRIRKRYGAFSIHISSSRSFIPIDIEFGKVIQEENKPQ
jgi:hypothetical protein